MRVPKKARPQKAPPGCDGYEIWDRDAAFLLQDFDTEEQALAFLHEIVRALSFDDAATTLDRFQLVEVSNDGNSTKVKFVGKALMPLIAGEPAAPQAGARLAKAKAPKKARPPKKATERVMLTCVCCGRADDFLSSDEAFYAEWDEPTHLPGCPVTCPSCLMTAMDDPDHTSLHNDPEWLADTTRYNAERKQAARERLAAEARR